MSTKGLDEKMRTAGEILDGGIELGMNSGIAEDKLKLLYLMSAGHCFKEGYVIGTPRDKMRYIFRRIHVGLVGLSRLTKKEMAEILPAYLVFYDIVKTAMRRKHPNVSAGGVPVQHLSCRE